MINSNQRVLLANYKYKLISTIVLTSLIVAISSCDTKQSLGLQESLGVIPELHLIEGGENSTVTVNPGTESYFEFDITDINSNKYIAAGPGKGWCILWNKPIDSNNATHAGLKLYSSYGDQQWKPLNYLLNIRESLMMNDKELTYREIQAAIWTLMDFPVFNMNNLNPEQLPSRMVENGQLNFDTEKTMQIVKHVVDNYKSFDYNTASTFAVVAETSSDTQTIIIEVSESVWAYGQHSFRDPGLRDQLGIRGEGKGQWGWIYELESGLSTAVTELIAGGGDDDGTMPAEDVGTIIGTLDISKSGNNMDVTYSPYTSYLLNDLHLWVGCSLEEFPWVGNTGNVAPGSFAHSYDDEPTDSHTFRVDLGDYNCPGNIFLAAHAGKLYQKVDGELPDDSVGVPVFKMTDLSQFGLTAAADINDLGHIVGGNFYWNSDSEILIDMGISPARALNNQGEVISSRHYWEINTGVIEIDTLNYTGIVTSSIRAEDINDDGYVVGEVDYCYRHPVHDADLPEDYCEYEFWSMEWHKDSRETREVEWFSYATSINNQGDITGVSATIPPHDIYVSFGEFGSFDGYDWGEPYAINNHRQVVGTITVFEESNSKILTQMERQNDNKVTNLVDMVFRITDTRGDYTYGEVVEMLRNNTFSSNARKLQGGRDNFDMNRMYNERLRSVWTEDEQRQIIETALSTSYRQEAFIWDEENGLNSLGEGTAYDINDHGQVVGTFGYWDKNHGIVELPNSGVGRAINNRGQIVGESDGTPRLWEISFEAQNMIAGGR